MISVKKSIILLCSLTSFTPTFGLDYSASTKPYGLCKKIDPYMLRHSNWCTKGIIKQAYAQKNTTKYGRQTVYSGPVGIQKGWCGNILHGSNDSVPVAISTKYIPLHAVSPNSNYCGKCMCIQVLSNDETSNPYPTSKAKKYYGKIFKGRVEDACSECDDDHIDILADRPYTYAPETKDNPKAAYYNSMPGLRAIPSNIVYSVGVWKTQWNFVNCNTDCTAFFHKIR